MDSIAGVLFVDVIGSVEVVSAALALICPSDLSSGKRLGLHFL